MTHVDKREPLSCANETKLCFAEAFLALSEEMSLDKITVNTIAEKAKKHRKTFYYHFSDKFHLMVWMFRYDLANELIDLFPESLLVWESPKEESVFAFPEFPFYIRNKLENGRMYNAPFFEALANVVERRRDFYRKVFSESGPGTLIHYLFLLYHPELKIDFIELLRIAEAQSVCQSSLWHSPIPDTQLSEAANIDFVTELFTGAALYRIVDRLTRTKQRRTLEEVAPYENIVHDSFSLIINATELCNFRTSQE